MTIVLGIDVGFTNFGYGVLELKRGKLITRDYGLISTKEIKDFGLKLVTIYSDLQSLLLKYKPEAVCYERPHFAQGENGPKMQETVGIIRLATTIDRIPLFCFTPTNLKKEITGDGKAEKLDMQEAMKKLLGLAQIPEPDHAADALAAAYVYLNSNNLLQEIAA